MSRQQSSPDTQSESEPRQRRQTRRRPRMIDNSVASPCLSVCRFDGEPYCIGCYRNADEIREWIIMTREQKLDVLENLKTRKKSAGIT
ncbi:MAG: DUF1289 domain-containing protein [Arenicellales bacterium]